ncbi:MAG: HAMP domain-containing sensor histidine kinase [Candidatus Moraniibacteriota bacterium]
MSWLKNDLNLKRDAGYLGLSVWQSPGTLYLVWGFLIAFLAVIVFWVAGDSVDPFRLAITEFLVISSMLAIGNILINTIDKLARVNRSKSEFVSIISHQLKTPLTGVSWQVELFNTKYKEGLNEKQKEILKNIELSNAVISRMVNDLLDVARIDQNNLFTKKEEIDIVSVIRKVIEKNEVLGKDNNVKIKFLVDDNMPKIIGDEKKTEVVLDNLISNAVKYNKKGGEVSIKVRKDVSKATISIRDNGIGIPKEDQEMIFDKFFRSDNAATQEVSGTGLGLFIAKNIIERSGGKIWFHSTEGEGSVFFVALPLV